MFTSLGLCYKSFSHAAQHITLGTRRAQLVDCFIPMFLAIQSTGSICLPANVIAASNTAEDII
jgi:hypothetical protein